MILRADFRVNTANEAFYKAFKVRPDQTEGRLIYELGTRQLDIPKLRELLEEILPRNSVFNDFEIAHDFPDIGRRIMLLNARRLEQEDGRPGLILLAMEDVTERKQAVDALVASRAELESHAEELERFNRAAVGRELQMIELKKEINELCGRQGEPARYPLEFEREEKDSDE